MNIFVICSIFGVVRELFSLDMFVIRSKSYSFKVCNSFSFFLSASFRMNYKELKSLKSSFLNKVRNTRILVIIWEDKSV
jgi:hypothetical protein